MLLKCCSCRETRRRAKSQFRAVSRAAVFCVTEMTSPVAARELGASTSKPLHRQVAELAVTKLLQWGRQWSTLQYSCLENPMDGGAS